jgi:hypothetical protein
MFSVNAIFIHLLTKQISMKIFTYILMILAVALVIFNITLLDFKNLTEGNSMVALIGIVASICAILILLIFRMSKSIVEKTKNL